MDRLSRLYAALPLQAEDASMETLHRIHLFSDTADDIWRTFSKKLIVSLPEDTQAFLEFVAWLQFCDEIASGAHADVGRVRV